MEEKDWEAGIIDDMDRDDYGNDYQDEEDISRSEPFVALLSPSELQTVTAARQRASTEVKALVAIIDRLTTRQW